MKVDIPDGNEQNIMQENFSDVTVIYLLYKHVFIIKKRGTLRNAVVS